METREDYERIFSKFDFADWYDMYQDEYTPHDLIYQAEKGNFTPLIDWLLREPEQQRD